jgi:hypothetical protein
LIPDKPGPPNLSGAELRKGEPEDALISEKINFDEPY